MLFSVDFLYFISIYDLSISDEDESEAGENDDNMSRTMNGRFSLYLYDNYNLIHDKCIPGNIIKENKLKVSCIQ